MAREDVELIDQQQQGAGDRPGDVRSQLTRQITTAVGDATIVAIAAMHWVEVPRRDSGDPLAARALQVT